MVPKFQYLYEKKLNCSPFKLSSPSSLKNKNVFCKILLAHEYVLLNFLLPLPLHWTTRYFLIFSNVNECLLSVNNVMYVCWERSIYFNIRAYLIKYYQVH